MRGSHPPRVDIAGSKSSSRFLPVNGHKTNHLRLYVPISENLAWTFWVTIILHEVSEYDELNEVSHWNATLGCDSADLFLVLWREPENEIS